MPALNFSKQFADAVESGEKLQTIRKRRKRPIKAGDTLYLYKGMRNNSGKKATLLRKVVCTRTEDITIEDYTIVIRGIGELNHTARIILARRDGFGLVGDFRAWFRDHYGLPFHGQLIVWDKENSNVRR